jgi:hypothetical protein
LGKSRDINVALVVRRRQAKRDAAETDHGRLGWGPALVAGELNALVAGELKLNRETAYGAVFASCRITSL